MIGRASDQHYLLFTGAQRFRRVKEGAAQPTPWASCWPAAGPADGRRRQGMVELDGKPMVAHVLARLAPQVASSDQRQPECRALCGIRTSGRAPTPSAAFAGPARRVARRTVRGHGARSSSPCRAIRRSCRRTWLRASRRPSRADDAQLAVARTFDQPHPVFALVRRDVPPDSPAFLGRAGARSTRGTRRSTRSRSRSTTRPTRFATSIRSAECRAARAARRQDRAPTAVRLAAPAHGRDNNFQLSALPRRGGGDPVSLLRADQPLDRRAALEAGARAQFRLARRQVLLRGQRISRHAELACAAPLRAVRRGARAADLPGAVAATCSSIALARGRARCRCRRSWPIPQTVDYALAHRARLGRCAIPAARGARSPTIRSRTRSTARCGRCRSNCGSMSRSRSPVSCGSSRGGCLWPSRRLIASRVRRAAGALSPRDEHRVSARPSHCCSCSARSRTCGARRSRCR